MVQHRVRIRFCKQADLRLISHRDLVRTLERMFRRAGIAVAMSEGFHPKSRLSFPAPLALGIAGVDEIMEVDLVEPIEPTELLAALAAQAPDGLGFLSAEPVPPETRKAQAAFERFELPLAEHHVPGVSAKVAEFLAGASCLIQRSDRPEAIDVRPLVDELEVSGNVLRMRLRVIHEAGVRPRDLLGMLGLDDLAGEGVYLTRTAVELQT